MHAPDQEVRWPVLRAIPGGVCTCLRPTCISSRMRGHPHRRLMRRHLICFGHCVPPHPDSTARVCFSCYEQSQQFAIPGRERVGLGARARYRQAPWRHAPFRRAASTARGEISAFGAGSRASAARHQGGMSCGLTAAFARSVQPWARPLKQRCLRPPTRTAPVALRAGLARGVTNNAAAIPGKSRSAVFETASMRSQAANCRRFVPFPPPATRPVASIWYSRTICKVKVT